MCQPLFQIVRNQHYVHLMDILVIVNNLQSSLGKVSPHIMVDAGKVQPLVRFRAH